MANAKKCDRCGTLYEIKFDADRPAYNGQKIRRFALITADITGPEERYSYDLCPNCTCALMSWFCAPMDKEDI